MTTPAAVPIPAYDSGQLVWTPADTIGIVSTVRLLDGAFVYGIKVGKSAQAWAEEELTAA